MKNEKKVKVKIKKEKKRKLKHLVVVQHYYGPNKHGLQSRTDLENITTHLISKRIASLLIEHGMEHAS